MRKKKMDCFMEFDLLRLSHCYLEQLIHYLVICYCAFNARRWISIFYPLITNCIDSMNGAQIFDVFLDTLELSQIVRDVLIMFVSELGFNSGGNQTYTIKRYINVILVSMKALSLINDKLYNHKDSRLIHDVHIKLNQMVNKMEAKSRHVSKDNFTVIFQTIFFGQNLNQIKMLHQKLGSNHFRTVVSTLYSDDSCRWLKSKHTCMLNDCCKSTSSKIRPILQFLLENSLYDDEIMSKTQKYGLSVSPLGDAIAHHNIDAVKILCRNCWHVITFEEFTGIISFDQDRNDGYHTMLNYMLVALVQRLLFCCYQSNNWKSNQPKDSCINLGTENTVVERGLCLISSYDDKNRNTAMIILCMILESFKERYHDHELLNSLIHMFKNFNCDNKLIFNKDNVNGDTFGHWCANYGNMIRDTKSFESFYFPIHNLLIKTQVLKHKFNFNGFTPLHIACKYGNIAMLGLLTDNWCKNGSSKATVDGDSIKTPLMIAIENQNDNDFILEVIHRSTLHNDESNVFTHLNIIEIRDPSLNHYNSLQYFVHYLKNNTTNNRDARN